MKFRYILSALAAFSLLAACTEEDPVTSYELVVDATPSMFAPEKEGGVFETTITATAPWIAKTDADWITFTPVSSGIGTTKMSITVAEGGDKDRTGEITLTAGKSTKIITVTQYGDPHGLLADDPLTCAEAAAICAEFASGEKSGKQYYVSGIISDVVEEFGTTYGNATFWMSDNGTDKTFEVYRCLYLDNIKYDDTSKQNISVGDKVVVFGIIMNYNGTPETSAGAAYLYSLDAGTDPVITCKEPEKVVGASETEASFTIAPKNLTEGWTVTTDAEWITDYTKSGDKDATEITVKFTANTDTEAREATLTVKSAGATDLVLTLKQGGYTASGTIDKPYTVAEAIAAIQDGTAAGNVYVKGIVSNTTKYNFGPTYNTASFWISDDGVYNDDLTKDFEAYSVYWLGGSLDAPTAAADIKGNFAIGDEVIIYGALTSYTKDDKTTYETASKKAKIYSINWATTDENGLGNVDYPFNVAGAENFIDVTQAAVAAAKEAGEELTVPDVAVSGKVSGIYSEYSASYGTAIFWISDDGEAHGLSEDKKSTTAPAQDFECYSVYWLENKSWEEGFPQIAVGDDVIVKGQLTIYKGTYETSSKKAYLYSLNGATTNAEITTPVITAEDISGVAAEGVTDATTTITLTNADDWTASVTPDGTIVTAASISGTTITYSVAANDGEARKGTITVTLKKDGETDVTKDIKVSQLAYEAPANGDGTLAAPFNIDGAIAYITDGGTDKVYVAGKVSKVVYTFSDSYGTGTFWISDDGAYNDDLTKDFECYSVYFFGGKSWVNGNTQVAVGDEVIIYGILTAFTNNDVTTYETKSKNAYVYSLNGVTSETVPTIAADDIADVAAAGVTDATATITVTDGDDWTASVTPDGTIVTAASLSGTTITYTVAANEGVARDGSIKVTLKKDGRSDCIKTIKVSQLANEGAQSVLYTLYSGAISEGDYVIYYGGKAMKNTVASNRLGYAEVTPNSDGAIADPDASIVWHIAANGDYWTIYSADASQYAASTGVKNQAKLESSVTDNSLWTVSGESTYEFVNKANDAAGINKNLRNNTTYGFACYATGTGGALSLYKLSE